MVKTHGRENESEMEFDFKGMSLHHLGEGLMLRMTPSRDQQCAMAAAHVSPQRKQKAQVRIRGWANLQRPWNSDLLLPSRLPLLKSLQP